MKRKSQKKHAKSNLVYDNYFTFFTYCDTKEFAKRPPGSKLNEPNEFKDKLELFHYDTGEIKPVNKDQKKT